MFKSSLSSGVVAAAFCAARVLGAAEPSTSSSASAPPPLSPVASFDPALSHLPESITADDQGNLYASLLAGLVVEITPDHAVTTVATLPLPEGGLATGIKLGPDGFIYVGSASFTAEPAAAFIWRVAPAGSVELFATLAAEGFPNDLAFDEAGDLYVTDPFLGQIWKIDPCGNATVWLADPLLLGNVAEPAFGIHEFGVDGIAFDARKKDLYVSNVDYGTVFRIAVSGRHAPQLEPFAEDARLKGVDGIAFDRRGTLYAAVNPLDRLATIDRLGTVAILTEGPPLDGPSSFAFGTGPDDARTLYVANFAINRFLAGEPASPGIASLPVRVPGLPLP